MGDFVASTYRTCKVDEALGRSKAALAWQFGTAGDAISNEYLVDRDCHREMSSNAKRRVRSTLTYNPFNSRLEYYHCEKERVLT